MRMPVADDGERGGPAERQFAERGVGDGVVVDGDVRRPAGRFLRGIFDVGDRRPPEEPWREGVSAPGALDDDAHGAVPGQQVAHVGAVHFAARNADHVPSAQGGVAPDPRQLPDLDRMAGYDVEVEKAVSVRGGHCDQVRVLVACGRF